MVMRLGMFLGMRPVPKIFRRVSAAYASFWLTLA